MSSLLEDGFNEKMMDARREVTGPRIMFRKTNGRQGPSLETSLMRNVERGSMIGIMRFCNLLNDAFTFEYD